MTAFAFVDGEGYPTGGGIESALPPGAVELHPPFSTFDLPRLRFRNGAWEIRPVQEQAPPSPEEIAAEALGRLGQFRREAIDYVNQRAGALRSRFVTIIPGQEMIYLIKEAEARAYLADPSPVLATYPFVSAEIGITGTTGEEVAQVYVNLAAILRATAAQLETARLGTIAAIEAATVPQAVEAALAAYNAALEAVG